MIADCFFCDYVKKYKNAETLKIPAFFNTWCLGVSVT